LEQVKWLGEFAHIRKLISQLDSELIISLVASLPPSPSSSHPLKLALTMTTAESYTFSTTFNDPEADIVLVSSNRTAFKIRRVHLISASDVFDDMLSSPKLGT
jgi:hypothetical protein